MARKFNQNTAEVVEWMKAHGTRLGKAVFREMKQSVVELHNAALKRVPRSARLRRRTKSRGAGARLAGSLRFGFVRRGKTVVGFVGTNLPYAQYTEIKGRNRNIPVGTPTRPKTSWPAKRARQAAGARFAGRAGQTMPWLRSAWALDVARGHLARMRKVLG